MTFNGLFRHRNYRYLWSFNRRNLHFNHAYASNTSQLSTKLQQDTLYRADLEKDACGVGMIANLNNDYNRKLITNANEMLIKMSHRGACGLDERCGDGAGILTNIPHSFFQKEVTNLPDAGNYGTGNVFFGKDLGLNSKIKDLMKYIIETEFGFKLLCWRPLPTNNTILGVQSLETEPVMEQIFICNDSDIDRDLFERRLLLLRNVLSNRITSEFNVTHYSYICSLSSKTITYKGQLTPEQLFAYYSDLQRDDFVSNFALVHSRFSTNTFPSWDRAQPNRISCHNGEINTLRGNKNWMHSRSGLAESPFFGERTEELFPICDDNMTDSGNFDSVLETLSKGSEKSLPEVVISMIPEAWQNDKNMPDHKKNMYEYLSCQLEPWDGPALIAFCDGNYAGAVLDRNGLRPSRYYVTEDQNIVFSSEIGVLPELDQSTVIEKGRLEPGKIFLIDLQNNRIIRDQEFKDKVSSDKPYKQWLDENLLSLNDLVPHGQMDRVPRCQFRIEDDEQLQKVNSKLNASGFTTEGMELLLVPMFLTGKEPLGSMGNDASLAVLSSKPKMPFEYFKQLFAQVTNPPIDPIRESFVMTLRCPVGPELNVFTTSDKHCKRLIIDTPILTEDEISLLKNVHPGDNSNRGWKSVTLDCSFKAYAGKDAMIDRINELCTAAENAIEKKNTPIIVLSDKKANDKYCAIPSLIAIGAIHHHLVAKQLRSKVAIFLECGDAKEVHDFSTLLGYGADGVCPYSVYNCISKLHYEENAEMMNITKEEAIKNYISAISKGLLKVMSKMGISTLPSYKGAQVFEAIGLNDDVVGKCFKGTESRIKGTNFDVIYTDILRLHEYGYGVGTTLNQTLRTGGDYHFRIKQEEHFNTPQTITALQQAVRLQNQDAYNEYSEMSNMQSAKVTLRGLLKFNRDKVTNSIDIDEVEPVSEVMRRFATGAMSLGSISRETHETLAEAMNEIQGRSNTGEGGEDPLRFGDNRRSAIKQVASGRFGVTINYLTNADQIQIKMAQGAKPGEGGELPGTKVSDYIGKIRHTTPGVGLISPPPHHDIYSIEDLSQLIFDLKQCNPSSSISVKLVSEIGVGIVAAGVTKAKADHITISGHDGGTGASAWTGIKNGGVPWELGIAEVQQTLVLNGLRDRVRIQTDGQLKTGRDVVIACLLGAEEFGFATAPLIALGCIMMRKCHLNTCPVGIATQDEELRKKFEGQPQHAVNYFYFLAEEVRGYMASLGFRTMNEMVGNTDFLKIDDAKLNYKSKHINLNPMLINANRELNHHHILNPFHTDYRSSRETSGVDEKWISIAREAIDDGKAMEIIVDEPLSNLNRTVGATLSHEIARKHGDKGLPDGTINIKCHGYGGQSFGCALAKGVTIQLEGDSNDYVGKLLSGGTLAIHPPSKVGFPKEEAHRHTIVGNACLYGATSGKVFFNGTAGERFAVRNSGATAVVEGVGDHGCEYMTGGRVIILGSIGKNFAAGMSGGIAYIYDLGDKQSLINTEMIGFESLDVDDANFVKDTLSEHLRFTDSALAKGIMDNFEENKNKFTKIMPHDYKRVMESRKVAKQMEQ